MTSVLPKSKLVWALAVAAIIAVLAPHAWSATGYKVLHNFGPLGGSDGSQPYGPALLDGKGNLYGVTSNGRRHRMRGIRLRHRFRACAPG